MNSPPVSVAHSMKTLLALLTMASAALAQDWTQRIDRPGDCTPVQIAALGADRLLILTKDPDPATGRTIAVIWSPTEPVVRAALAPSNVFANGPVLMAGMPGTKHVYVAAERLRLYRYDAD